MYTCVGKHMYVYICMTRMYVYIPSFQSPHGPSAVASASLKSHGFLAVTAQKGKALSELKSHLGDRLAELSLTVQSLGIRVLAPA